MRTEWINDEAKAKRTVKDTVFTDLFAIPRYKLELVKALHPELDVAESDIKTVSLNSILIAKPYNDLGLLVKDRLLILVEAQATWTINVIVRMLLYLAATYQNYIREHKFNIYGSKKLILPKPEFYVIYTGKRKNCPRFISLADEFFGGAPDIELRARVIVAVDAKNIISEYIRFCHVLNERIKKYGRTRQAIDETIRICRDENVLNEYFESRSKEVVTIMMTLFSQEEIMDAYEHELIEKGIEKGIRKGLMNTLMNMLKKRFPYEMISDALEMSIEDVARIAKSAGLAY